MANKIFQDRTDAITITNQRINSRTLDEQSIGVRRSKWRRKFCTEGLSSVQEGLFSLAESQKEREKSVTKAPEKMGTALLRVNKHVNNRGTGHNQKVESTSACSNKGILLYAFVLISTHGHRELCHFFSVSFSTSNVRKF